MLSLVSLENMSRLYIGISWREREIIQVVVYRKETYGSSFHSIGTAVFMMLQLRTWPKEANSSEKDWRSTKSSHWIVSSLMQKYLQNTLENSSSPYVYQKMKDDKTLFAVLWTNVLFEVYLCVYVVIQGTKQNQEEITHYNAITFKKIQKGKINRLDYHWGTCSFCSVKSPGCLFGRTWNLET